MSKVEYDTKKSNSWEKKDRKPKDISQEEFVKVCSESRSMTQAAATLGMHFGTFIKYTKKWNGKPIALELNHINGNGWEHRKSNLEWLCPNCHSQTHNFRGKNK